MGSLPKPDIRRIAIVGAGPAGVATAKYLQAEEHFQQIDIFEQQRDFGGVWNYHGEEKYGEIPIPQIDPRLPQEPPQWRERSDGDGAQKEPFNFVMPMYEGLETNIPHVLMRYSDAFSLQENQLFPPLKKVLEYLKTYSRQVRDMVQFHTQVIDVQLQREGPQDTWTVETQDLLSGTISKAEYDAVVVASGHYSVPSLPEIRGIKEWNAENPGMIAHSKYYRNQNDYRDKKVLVIGNGASGTDIAAQISSASKLPVYVSQRSDSPLAYPGDYKRQMPEIAEFLPSSFANRAVRFTDDSVLADLDAVLFCTGYFYSFPFLSDLEPGLISTGERVQHLYRHLFYFPHPSLVFIGLPLKIIPFRTFEGQAAVVARVWSGRLPLPPQQEMSEWEQQELAKHRSERSFHVLKFPDDFQYHNDLVEWAMQAAEPLHGHIPPKWSDKELWQRERFPAIKKVFAEQGDQRHQVRSLEKLGFDYAVVAQNGTESHDRS